MSYQLTKTTFTTTNNADIFNVILPDTIREIYLHGFDKIDVIISNDLYNRVIVWPRKLEFLEIYFRPDFSELPPNLVTLSIVTQNEVRKSDLPKNIQKLIIIWPNSESQTFYPNKDKFDLYKVSIIGYGKYNKFIGGYYLNDVDNIKHHKVKYEYRIDGDSQYPSKTPSKHSRNTKEDR